MSIVFLPEKFHSLKQDKDFYNVRVALIDSNGNVLHKSKDPVFFITEEEYLELTKRK